MAFNNNATNEIKDAMNQINKLGDSIDKVNDKIDDYNKKTDKAVDNTNSYASEVDVLNQELKGLVYKKQTESYNKMVDKLKKDKEQLKKYEEQLKSYEYIDKKREEYKNRKREAEDKLGELGINKDEALKYKDLKLRRSELSDKRYEYEEGEIGFDEDDYSETINELNKITEALDKLKNSFDDEALNNIDSLIDLYQDIQTQEDAYNISIKNKEQERLNTIKQYEKLKTSIESQEESKRIKDLRAGIKEKEALDKKINKKPIKNKEELVDKRLKLEDKLESLHSSIVKNKTSTISNTIGASLGSLTGNNTSKSIFNILKNSFKGLKRNNDLRDNLQALNQEMAEVGGNVDTLGVGMSVLSSEAIVAVGAIGALVAALGLMVKVGKQAYERDMLVNRALLQMGVNSSTLNDSTSETANQIIRIKNEWVNIIQDLGDEFKYIFEGLVDIVDVLTKAVRITVALGTDLMDVLNGEFISDWIQGRIQGGQNKPEMSNIEKVLKDWQDKEGLPVSKSAPIIADIASKSKLSGFDNKSAQNLGIGTYKQAIELAKRYGLEVEDVADRLAEAWLRGSDAAKEFGVILDDQTLIGFMASKGVDIVNVEITDAMRQYYRYQLMLEQTSNSNSDAMQEQIKKWKQLGFIIDKTKGKLFSFDEVINLQAVDPEIPIVDSLGDVKDTLQDTKEELKDTFDPKDLWGGFTGINGGGPLTPSLKPVTVPVTYAIPKSIDVPEPKPVIVPVEYETSKTPEVPNLEPVTLEVLFEYAKNKVTDLVEEWGKIVNWGLVPVTLTALVTIPGLASVLAFDKLWEKIRAKSGEQVDFVLNTVLQGKEALNNLVERLGVLEGYLNKQNELGINVGVYGLEAFNALNTAWDELLAKSKNGILMPVMLTVSGAISLFESLYKKLESLLGGVEVGVNVEVGGLADLKLASNLLSEILTKANELGARQQASGFREQVLQQAASSKEEQREASPLYNNAMSILTIQQEQQVARDNAARERAAQEQARRNQAFKEAQEMEAVYKQARLEREAEADRLARQAEEAALAAKRDAAAYAADQFVEGFKAGNASILSKWSPVSSAAYGGGLMGDFKADFDMNLTRLGFKNATKEGYTTKDLWGATSKFSGANYNPLNFSGAAGASALAISSYFGGMAGLGLQSAVSSTFPSIISKLPAIFTSAAPAIVKVAPGFASGGIGTREIHNATLFEDNKKEAIIPLESEAGIRYLSEAMKEADSGRSGAGSNIEIHLSLNGLFDTDDRGKWEALAERLAESIDVQIQRRGSLGYGASY